jgi:hypothetical protein
LICDHGFPYAVLLTADSIIVVFDRFSDPQFPDAPHELFVHGQDQRGIHVHLSLRIYVIRLHRCIEHLLPLRLYLCRLGTIGLCCGIRYGRADDRSI